MRPQNQAARNLSILLFSLGILLGTAFSSGAVWADFEAFQFENSLGAEGTLTTLKCPILITGRETGTVSATFANPTDRRIERAIRTYITRGLVSYLREENTRLPLEPGETRRLEWQVAPQDAAWGHFILVRVIMFRSYPLPSLWGSCGVLVLDLPILNGSQWAALLAASSVALVVAGGWLWFRANPAEVEKRTGPTNAMIAVAGVVLAGMAANLLGWYVVAGLLLVLTVLLVAAVVLFLVLK